jgi:2-oxoglutarate ferredoxin oxidoreductase subunit alpha
VYDPENHTQQTEKRFRKLQTALREIASVKIIGDVSAKIGVLSWGSSTGAAIEAIDTAKRAGIKIKVLKTTLLWPLPRKEIIAFCASVKKVIVPEMNFQGQFAGLLGFIDQGKLVKANFVTGVPVSPDDIMEHILKVHDVLRKK